MTNLSDKIEFSLLYLKEYGRVFSMLGVVLLFIMPFILNFIYSDIIIEPSIGLVLMSSFSGLFVILVLLVLYPLLLSSIIFNLKWSSDLNIKDKYSKRVFKRKIFRAFFEYYVPSNLTGLIALRVIYLSSINAEYKIFSIASLFVFFALYPVFVNLFLLVFFKFKKNTTCRNKKYYVFFHKYIKKLGQVMFVSFFAIFILSLIVPLSRLRLYPSIGEEFISLYLICMLIYFLISSINIVVLSRASIFVSVMLYLLFFLFAFNLSDQPVKKILGRKGIAYILKAI